jgi:hypothetical protein
LGAARKCASLAAWVKTNVDKASGGGNPTYTSGVPSAARTDDTQRAITETILKAAIASGWDSGAAPKVLMVGSWVKRVVSGFSGIATRNFDLSNVSPKPTAIIAAADVYVSDFGTLRVLPNRFQRGRDAWGLDWEMLALGVLRPMEAMDLAKTGDATKKMVLTEYTLQVKQEAGLFLCADLSTS